MNEQVSNTNGNPRHLTWQELASAYQAAQVELAGVRQRVREIGASSVEPYKNEFWKAARSREDDLVNWVSAVETEILSRVQHITPSRWHLEVVDLATGEWALT